ncbi:hypothetical protein BT67DRAFT_451324 [Trichocladium antarcticum]|uniref:Fungal-type protein kinase domain-containing protein n=1 Tax=Trichocladium antarcticum TaxID=1450529 RepID=A0AAN6UG92_9PEZI|nr:hypothetical protein BT67DRAFT_451324 [Trichocladium antarcticum]
MPFAMADQPRSKIIKDNPIGKGLDTFRALFNAVCADRGIPCTLDALVQLDQEDLLPVTRLLPSNTGRGTLQYGLLRLISAAASDDFDLDRIRPLLKSALADDHNDALVWDQVYDALRNTSSFANSSEHREYIDNVLKEELGPIYVGLRDFYKTYFGDVPNLETVSETFFEDCLGGSNLLFGNGWRGWPEEAKQDDVLSWFVDFTEKLAAFIESYNSAPVYKRRPLAKPDEPIAGSIRKRKMDIGFVADPSAGKDSRCHWSQILVPSELKTRLDLGRYAREVFDRLGGIASEQFDINKDRLRFVSTILGFLWISEEELRFDPTIMTAKGQRFIEIEREGTTERLILDRLMNCARSYREEDPDTLFRNKEGGLLRKATSKGTVYIARYYYYETVQALDITKATNYRQNRSRRSLSTSIAGPSRIGRSSSIASAKRSSYETGTFLPPSKRPCSTSPTKASSDALPNRVHRRDNSGFLIDLDLAIKEQCVSASGAKGKTSTRAFIAIGALLGEQHSFIHDLDKGKVISNEGDFIKVAEENFTLYYKPMVPWVNKLRKVVFPNGRRWEREDSTLYARMRGILKEARKGLADI